MRIIILILPLITLLRSGLFAQRLFPSQEIVDKIWNRTSSRDNSVYVPYIQTVQFYLSGSSMTYPNLFIDGEAVLELRFDDIDSIQHSYLYTIEQYDALWQTQNSDVSSYIEGFGSNSINDYELSVATSIPYRHYVLQIPNRDVKIKRSGNYLLKISDGSTGETVLTRRFTVYDTKIDVNASLRMSHGLNTGSGSHELVISLGINRVELVDIFSDLQVVVVPNGVWHRAVSDIKPQFISGNTIKYEKTILPCNEFRTLNIKELSTNYSDIQDMFVANGIVHVQLPIDGFRADKPYRNSGDMNGLNHIEKFGAFDSNTESDYFYAHFTLASELPLLEGNVYLFGALTNYSFSPWNLMIYDIDKAAYETQILLKQGFHDYCYVFVNNYDCSTDFKLIEGNYQQTNNDYLVFVYIRNRGTGHSDLLGYTVVTSLQ